MKETTIISGQYPLRAYEEEGRIFGAEAIPEIVRIIVSEIDPTQNFTVPDEKFGIHFTSIVGQGLTQLRQQDFLIMKAGRVGSISWGLEILQSANYHQASSTFNLALPNLYMDRNEYLGFETNVTGLSLAIFGKKIHIDNNTTYEI